MRCPALLISAPASGQGKTTLTAALARWHARQGRRVRVFKVGPDFLDPMVLARACGSPVEQLDLWMCGEQDVRARLHAAACEADLILVEGVMGLFDGHTSSADIACLLGIPVLALIDGSAMAQTFGALAHGLRTFRPGLPFAGVMANRVSSDSHASWLREGLPSDLPWWGALPRQALTLPSRHLGLVQASELRDLDALLDGLADALPTEALRLPPAVDFADPCSPPLPQYLKHCTVAIAHDAAFSFMYSANVQCLLEMGARIEWFSPLADDPVPDGADAVYLPGGYPELHLETLGQAQQTRDSLRRHHVAGRPLWAECGGMLALLEELAGQDGHPRPMWGLLPGYASLQPKLVHLGLHTLPMDELATPAAAGEAPPALRGHSYHHAKAELALHPWRQTLPQRSSGRPEAIYRSGRLTASFFHAYFPSHPLAAAALLRPGLLD